MEWWESFFDEKYLRWWQWAEERTAPDVDFVTDVLELKVEDRILDLCCGHGRHSIELARRGLHVTGFDQSGYLLSVARQRAAEARVSVEFTEGDMRQLPFDREFDVVLNLVTSFGYFEDERDDRKALGEIAKALKPRGRFLIDTMNREWLVRNFRPRDWQELGDDAYVLESRQLDLEDGRTKTDWTIIEGGKVTRREFGFKLYPLHELKQMMREAGLDVIAKYGGLNKEDYTIDSPRMIVVCEKRDQHNDPSAGVGGVSARAERTCDA